MSSFTIVEICREASQTDLNGVVGRIVDSYDEQYGANRGAF